ncbi:hypothetical protein TVAG_095830 [Trichomonas vaginalis G3]|uniref:Uncharacterized protein n=1 Tax=Trichomonas vaginalis (strain ATCC PRA-98 / G3) TaxID=412133 RepID=A2G3V5_TRIV3|nr:hypothetical protein TVAG_095830 [Trichomonas vaginalis G3]|eukprot:XP_001301090.1 hypothetical protein [Trichomonas vaginalis G3]
MLSLITTLAHSYTVSSTGYDYMSISSSNTDLKFDLKAKSSADYYIAFVEDLSSIYIDGKYLSNRVYKISYPSATYKISSTSTYRFHFGIFLLPKTYDSLEFWIVPASETYTISKSSSSSYDYYLVILDYTDFDVSVEKSDSNYVYYSYTGDIPGSPFVSGTLYNKKIVTLLYKYKGYSASTSYTVTANSYNSAYNYKYSDNSESHLNFNNGISISSLSSSSGSSSSGGSSTSGSFSYGSNSMTISSSTTYSIPEDTLIVFTKSKSIEGKAAVGSTTLDILGSLDRRAILFSSSGTLTLTSISSSQTCNFIAYNYSTLSSSCNYVTILSGTAKYKLQDPDDNKLYCVVSAFTSGRVDIKSDNLYHFSKDAYGSNEYSTTQSDKNEDNPIITVTFNSYFFIASTSNGKIEFDLRGSSSDDNYAIDGSSSKYDFYKISSSSYSKMNSYRAVGKSSVSGDGLPTWAIVIIVIVVIIIVISIICTICFICCCSSGCCSSSSSTTISNNHHEEYQVETVQEDRPTPVQTNTAPASYYSPPPPQLLQQQQQQQSQPNYIPPPPHNVPPQQANPYNSAAAQQPQPPSSVYGAPPQQPAYGAPPQQSVFGAPPQQSANPNFS